ncbi:hypothetical protein [Acetobacter sp. DsW_063]|uniref:hypothetical protein n=1 Tax=Acetobacter sp. DsW_063 TaxID=1514894 RepID=UPI000A3CA956|nr:hypothetical protein [Acetobacter sp. DsW_063]OUJ15565.1 hypothetical protein HK28_07215 [Acetobacter sp. DsW_063]
MLQIIMPLLCVIIWSGMFGYYFRQQLWDLRDRFGSDKPKGPVPETEHTAAQPEPPARPDGA